MRGDALRLNDPRASTLEAYLRVLDEAKPRAFLLENVPGLTYTDKDEGLVQILQGIEAINRRQGTNYQPHYAVLNAASYGVPQLRERVFIIGSRDGASFTFPKAGYVDPSDARVIGGDVEPYFTAWDAIGDLPAPKNNPSSLGYGRGIGSAGWEKDLIAMLFNINSAPPLQWKVSQ